MKYSKGKNTLIHGLSEWIEFAKLALSAGLLCISTFLLVTIEGYAQTIDTLNLKSSEFAFYVVEKDSLGKKIGAICYYDKEDRLRKTVNHNETVWYTYIADTLLSYRVTKFNGKNEIINPDEFYDENDNLIMTQMFKDKKLILRTYYDTLGNKIHDFPYKKGQLHGTTYSYHPNGNIEWSKGYKKGKLSGERILRDSTGNLVTGEDIYPSILQISHYNSMCQW